MAKRRAPMVRLPAVRLAAPLALLGVALSAPALADIRFQPAVNVRETYTDNVQQSADNPTGEFITDLSPSLNMLINGPRVKLVATVAAHQYIYAGARPNNTNSGNLQFSTTGKADLIDELLYLDGAASRSRQIVSPFGQQSQNGYNDVNSDDLTSYRISPYLVQRFGNLASGQLRYTRDSVQSSSGRLGNSHGDSVIVNLASGPVFNTVGWDLQGYHQSVSDPLAGQSDNDNAVATLRYRLKRTLSVYANTGYDRYSYEGLGGSNGGKSYAAGFTWVPSQRTSIDASIGRRYFGKTYSLAAAVRSRHTIWNATYRDEITTARAQFLRPNSIDTASLLDASFASAFPDPVARRQAVLAYIAALGLPLSVANNVNYFSNRLLLQKQFLASVVLNGQRSALIASVSNTKRNALTPPGVDAALATDIVIGGLTDDTRQRTASLAANYRLASHTAATVSVSKSRVLSVATGIEQNQTTFDAVLTHQFDRKLSGNVDVRRSQGDTFAVRGRGYRENAVSASLNYLY